jgi:2-oxoglutarate ferredoxin oxidoreductase subunit alpha
MPTRTQQSDITLAAYASHGDTKHVLLFPSTPTECFEMTAKSFDLAEQLQTPVIIMSDLDLGMNDHMCDPFTWNDKYEYDRGKLLDADDLEKITRFGRYLDVDDDGIPYRTFPAVHPSKGAYVVRGTSRDEYATYTEDSPAYKRNMDRLVRKWNTAKTYVPKPEIYQQRSPTRDAMLFFGTTTQSALEARDYLGGIDAMRLRAFPFCKEVADFVSEHDRVFVVEQNRDGQMRGLLITEFNADPKKFIPVLNYDGLPITAAQIVDQISIHMTSSKKK